MGEWDFSPEVIAKAQEIGIGARVAVHWSEAECQDQEGTVVGVDIHRYGKVDYTVHIDGDLAPTDGFVHDRSGIFGGTIRLIAPSLSLEEEVKAAALHVEQLSELLKIIKENWIDYDHVFSISVDEAEKWLASMQSQTEPDIVEATAKNRSSLYGVLEPKL